MRRAPIVLVLLLTLLTFSAVRTARAAGPVTRINGVGLIDYTRKPEFKVGDYVKYDVIMTNLDGVATDHYTITLLIAGQEIFWGERCFDVETWTEDAKRPRGMTNTLMSYSIFEDSIGAERRDLYMRKTILGINSDGGVQEVLVLPKATALTSRTSLQKPHTSVIDTLGADTVHTSMGVLPTRKLVIHEGWGNTGGSGDSTIYKEIRQDRTRWLTDQVPITHCAKEQMDALQTMKAWLIGRSREAAPATPLEGGTVSARLIEYGHGLQAKLLPAERRKSFEQLAAEASPKRAAGTARRPATGTAPKR